MGTGVLSSEIKRQGRGADHSPPTSAEVKKIWIYTFTPPYAFVALCFTGIQLVISFCECDGGLLLEMHRCKCWLGKNVDGEYHILFQGMS
jgi:hypothetical protein